MTVERLPLRRAVLVFDPVDRWAMDRGIGGPHPRPFGRVAYRLVGRVVGGVRRDLDQPYDRPAELAVVTGPSGYDVFLGAVVLADGRRFQADLPNGQYVVQASNPLYQRGERDDILVPPLPPAPPPPPAPPIIAYRFDLEPGYAYPFPSASTIPAGLGPTLLRGAVHAAAGAGVGAVEVEAPGQSNRYRTDETGRWALVFPDSQPAGAVTVRFTFPGGAVHDAVNVPLQQGVDNPFAQTALQGRVLAGGAGVGGATVAVAGRPGTASTDPAGRWRYYLPVDEQAGQVEVRATLPDRRSRAQPAVPIQPQRTNPGPVFQFP